MSKCDGWRIWQHNHNPNIRYLVPERITKKVLLQIEQDTVSYSVPVSVDVVIPLRTQMHPDLDIHEVAYNQTVDAGTFPPRGLLDYYHPEGTPNILSPGVRIVVDDV